MTSSSESVVRDAFLAAYEAHADAIFRFCLAKVSDRERAVDLTQDTFVRVWEYATKGNDVSHWRALLYTTANNAIIDYYRKKKAISLDALEEDIGFIPADTTLSQEDRTEVERIHRAIRELKEEYRDVAILRFIEDMQPRDIAEILGLSVNVVSVRIHRAMEKLKIHLHTTI